MTDVAAARERLAVLRREAAELIALVDTSEYPVPAGEDIHPLMPGPYWEVDDSCPRGPRWRVIASPEHTDVVFLGAQDFESWAYHAARWTPTTADVQAVRIADARRYAMSILAACRWLDERRKPELRVATP